jgi:hypothetical protein
MVCICVGGLLAQISAFSEFCIVGPFVICDFPPLQNLLVCRTLSTRSMLSSCCLKLNLIDTTVLGIADG